MVVHLEAAQWPDRHTQSDKRPSALTVQTKSGRNLRFSVGERENRDCSNARDYWKLRKSECHFLCREGYLKRRQGPTPGKKGQKHWRRLLHLHCLVYVNEEDYRVCTIKEDYRICTIKILMFLAFTHIGNIPCTSNREDWKFYDQCNCFPSYMLTLDLQTLFHSSEVNLKGLG